MATRSRVQRKAGVPSRDRQHFRSLRLRTRAFRDYETMGTDARKAVGRQVNDPQVPTAWQRFETALEMYLETYFKQS